jgi:hypothetical protein
MANALQLRRGTTTEHASFTGLVGEVTVDTTKDTVVVHDGSTAGGYPLAKFSDLTIANVTNLQTNLDAKVDLAGDTMTGFLTLHADPTSAFHAATKEYVDTIAAAGIHYHEPVRVETPSNLNATYDNGSSGVGATLTNAGTNAAITIDGVALSSADRVLVYNQTNAAHNGIYTVTTVGDGSTAWVLTRATDADSYGTSDPDAFGEGDAFFVKEGDTGAGELYVMNTTGTITFGTTDITFTVIAETAVYTAGTGMSLDGTTFSIGQPVATSDTVTFAAATINGNITVTGTVDGRDVAADGTKLDGIEAGADVTDADNVSSAGALMDSELTNITAVKALNQGVSTSDSPTFAGGSFTGNVSFGDGNRIYLGAGNDLEILHDGSDSYVRDIGTGSLFLQGTAGVNLRNASGEDYIKCTSDGLVQIYHDNSEKLRTLTDGIQITGNLDASGWIGIDSGDNISFSNNAHMNVDVNGATRVRIEADGDMHADGDVIAYSTTISDPRLKTDIQKIEGALDKLCTLSGYTFTYTPDNTASAGILSTEVAKVLPSAIRPKKLPLKTGDEETVYDTVQYDQLHGLLIEAIKELREEVADLKAKIEG